MRIVLALSTLLVSFIANHAVARPYFEVGGGLSPMLALDGGYRDHWGAVELGLGTGNAGQLFGSLFSFENRVDTGYFALRYRTPEWHGLSASVGPALHYRGTEVDTIDVMSDDVDKTCIGCEEAVAYGRFYQAGPEIGLSWVSDLGEDRYIGVDIAGWFTGTSSFVRKERQSDSLDEDWTKAKERISEWGKKQSLSTEWTRLAAVKAGFRF